jgi:hypothetical protein
LEYDNQQMKLLVAIYLPPHIVDDSELKVEFAEGIDSKLVLWMPRGPLVCVKTMLRNEHLQSPITAHQLELENSMYYKYSEHLLDPFSIELVTNCNVNQVPSVKVGDTGDAIFVLLVVLEE